MHATTIDLDLAKNVFQVHGIDAEDQAGATVSPPRPWLSQINGPVTEEAGVIAFRRHSLLLLVKGVAKDVSPSTS